MAFWNKKKKTKENPKQLDKKHVDATSLEARIFFKELIESYSDTFRVDTPEQSLLAYKTIPQLNTVINRSAKAFIAAKKNLYKINKLGEKELVESGSFYDVLKNPHLLQSENEFWETFYKNWKIYGIVMALKNINYRVALKTLLILPTVDIEIILKDHPNYLNPKSIEDIIDYYQINKGEGEATKITDVESIWMLQDSSLKIRDNNYIIPENPLKSLEKTLGTLHIIANIKNELLGNHGAIGIINPDSRDADGDAVTLMPKEKQALQDAYDKYGIIRGKNKLIITNTSIKFTAISLKIAELLLTEFEKEASITLANNQNFPLPLLTSNSKYENKSVGNKELYQGKIIPESSIIESSFNAEFKDSEEGQILEFDFSDIVYLQDDIKEKAERNAINTKTLIDLNKSVSNGEMDKETAVNILTNQGMSEEEAEKLIHEPIVVPANNNTSIEVISQEQLQEN